MQIEFNQNGSLLLLRFGPYTSFPFCQHATEQPSPENVPNVIFIYDFPSDGAPLLQPKLQTVIMNSKPILHARWNPIRAGRLAFCTGERSIYHWSDEWVGEDAQADSEGMTECVGVPARKRREPSPSSVVTDARFLQRNLRRATCIGRLMVKG